MRNATSDKEDELKQERMPRMVAKIHIPKTSNGMAEMDFVDFGGKATFPHLQDTFSRYPTIVPTCSDKKNKVPIK